MRWHPWREASVRAAAFAVLVAAGFVAASAWRGVRPVVAESTLLAADGKAAEMAAPPRIRPIDRLVALAPFEPERRASTSSAAALQIPVAGVPPAVRLLGTVVGDGVPFAVCKLGAGTPRFLHAGDTLGGWTLRVIAPALVVFVDGGGVRHEVRLSSPGS